MKQLKYIIIMVLGLMATASYAQNRLYVTPCEGGADKSVNIPVSMACNTDIVAVQFDVELPYPKTSYQEPSLNLRRINGHTISMRSLGSNRYTVVVVSMANKTLSGNDGILLNVPIQVPLEAQPGDEYPIRLTNCVMSDKQGNNVIDSSTDGTFTVQREASPDLQVSAVSSTTANLIPGQEAMLQWTVRNVGGAGTRGGWVENVYLENVETEESFYLGKQYMNNLLAKGAFIERHFAFTIPTTIGTDGEVRIRVDVTPNANTGEYLSDRANNTATSEDSYPLAQRLFLVSPVSKLGEASQSARLTLQRSGSRDMAQTFTLQVDHEGMLTIPATVTIPAGQSSTAFTVTTIDNEDVNPYDAATITVAAAHGYEAVSVPIEVEDNDMLPMTIHLDKAEYNEGETMHLTVSVPRLVGGQAPVLNLAIEQNKRFTLPMSVSFAPGALSTVVDIPIVQDNTPANAETIKLAVAAEHYLPASTLFILNDDDVPAISLTLTPTTISEGAGHQAIMGTLTRSGVTNNKITVKLRDDSNNELYYTNVITLPAGTTEAEFTIGVRDNIKVEGDRTVNLTAGVYLTDCDCSAIGAQQSVVRQTITITDDDGPALLVEAAKNTILEGDAQGTMLTISRNTDGSEGAITVDLSCTTADTDMPHQVVIPAGATSVQVPFVALKNSVKEGDRVASIWAKAEGYSNGTTWLLISDQTLPDAAMVSIVPSSDVIEAGAPYSVTLRISNIGASKLPKGTTLRIRVNGQKVKDVNLDTDLEAPGMWATEVAMPALTIPGTYTLQAEVNPNHTPQELQYANNTCENKLQVESVYQFTIQADRTVYNQGGEVTLTGRATTLGGTPAGGIKVEPYIINHGLRTALSATTDQDGYFSVTHTLTQGMCGQYIYGVCNPDEKLSTEMGRFNVYGFARTSAEYLKYYTYVDDLTAGSFTIKNLSDEPLHNIQVQVIDPTERYIVAVAPVADLAGGGTQQVSYGIQPRTISQRQEWDVLTLRFTCDEGETMDVNLYCFSRLHEPTLVTDPTTINTTITKGTQRIIPVHISNTGLGETGRIDVVLPSGMRDFISLATPSQMPTMLTGDTAQVLLRFTAGSLPVNVIQKGSLVINPENGSGVSIPFNIKVVSEAKGSLRVYACDEATQHGMNGEHPYVSGATIQLTDYNTGAICGSGTTDENGYVDFTDMDEGYYQLYVTAPKHDSYRQNVLISPGESNEVKAYISYKAVSISWNVEETTVEDEYEITTKLTYETQVPVPVVLMTAADTIPLQDLSKGQSLITNVVVRNKGLITAERFCLTLPTVKGFSFHPLKSIENVDIAPDASYVIPILVTNDSVDIDDETDITPVDDLGFVQMLLGDGGGGGSGTPGGGGGSGNDGSPNGPGGGGGNPGGDNGPGGGGGGNDGPGGGGGGTPGGGGGTPGGGGGTPGGGGGGTPGGGGGGGNGGGGGGYELPCKIQVQGKYEWPCGENSKLGFVGDICNVLYGPRYRNTCGPTYSGSIPTRPRTDGPGGPGSHGDNDPSPGGGIQMPDPDIVKDLLCLFLECIPADIPGGNCIRGGINVAKGRADEWDAVGCAADAASLGTGVGSAVVSGAAGGAATGHSCEQMAKDQAKKYGGMAARRAPRRAQGEENADTLTEDNMMPELLVSHFLKTGLFHTYMGALADKCREYTATTSFIDQINGQLTESIKLIDSRLEELYDEGLLLELDTTQIPISCTDAELDHAIHGGTGLTNLDDYRWAELTRMMPAQRCNLYDFNLRSYVDRRRNDMLIEHGLEPLSDNYARRDTLNMLTQRMDSCEAKLVEWGYVDWAELCQSANEDRLEFYENQSKNTCAHVKLQISQKLVLTRQAFRGTLTIENDTDTPLTDINLAVTATNMLGELATSHEMQMNMESIDGFTGDLNGPWTLDKRSKGVATILFIPTKYAAIDTLTTYSFGGTLSYHDGDSQRTTDLYPVRLQVKPSPELDLTYFMQRDIYGDNPLTEDIEPIIPAEFTVLIHNKGRGEASNVRMLTKQPEILDNEKGLNVDFAIVSSSLNGGERVMALADDIATEFGDIPAGSSSYATWDLTCNLLGHFTDYEISHTHLTSYGNPDLSLLDRVTIHELIHSVNATVGDRVYRAWVTNDFPDGHEEPDHIYLANGTDESLVTLTDVTQVQNIDGTHYRLSVDTPQKEWFYTKVTNPGMGHSRVLSIVNEETGQQLDPENFWTTDYTMMDGWDPVLEYKLHIVDLAPRAGTRSYIIEFEPQPEKWLAVEDIATVPSDDAIVEEPIEQLTVRFNKDIDYTTFTRDDIVLRYEGHTQDIDIPITRATDSQYTLNTAALSENGMYTLQVKAEGITDQEGFQGVSGKMVRWMLFKDGLVRFDVDSYPADCGDITTSEDNAQQGHVPYGRTLHLVAQPRHGYEFLYWARLIGQQRLGQASPAPRRAPVTVTADQLQQLSTQPTLDIDIDQTSSLRAVFRPLKYQVRVECPARQATCSVATGLYDYGTQLTLQTTPAEGYEVRGYCINGIEFEVNDDALSHLTVQDETTIQVRLVDTTPVPLLLNEDSLYTPVEIENANVTLYRAFRKGTWNSICLPCPVPDVQATFGPGTQVARLSGINERGVVQFSLVPSMQANVPYIIKPGRLNQDAYEEGKSQKLRYNIGLTSTHEPQGDEPVDACEGIRYIGTYSVYMIDAEDNNYYISSDRFYYVDAAAAGHIPTVRFRGYFHTDQLLGARLDMGFGDDPDAILLPQAPVRHTGVYRLDGVQVRPADASLQGLPRGLYIVNGRTIQVR